MTIAAIGVALALVALILLMTALLLVRRRRRHRQASAATGSTHLLPVSGNGVLTQPTTGVDGTPRELIDRKISVVVPCHRVIGGDGSLTGYGGGLDRKRWLLAHERAEELLAIV